MRSTPLYSTEVIGSERRVPPPGRLPSKPNDCPGLNSLLLQIVHAPNPLEQAKRSRLNVKENKVHVLLVLDREDTRFLQAYGVEIGKRSGTQVQAFVPIDHLCDLSKTAEVLAIRLPAEAIPQ